MNEITRWEKWFSKDNLEKDKRILQAPPSCSAKKAANIFQSLGKEKILDLGCGIGRDANYLARKNLEIIGLDASQNGLRVAQELNSEAIGLYGWVTADARVLPFKNESFDGVYSFGLLHEFTGKRWEEDVKLVVEEIWRLLIQGGVLVLTVLSGEPSAGLPKIQFFTGEMLVGNFRKFQRLVLEEFDDVGCTGRDDYRVCYGVFRKEDI